MERCEVPFTKRLMAAIDEADRQGVGMALGLLMDACSSDDAQWEGGDVCEALGNVVGDLAGWADPKCPIHHCYSAAWMACPFCTTPTLWADVGTLAGVITAVIGEVAPGKIELLTEALVKRFTFAEKA